MPKRMRPVRVRYILCYKRKRSMNELDEIKKQIEDLKSMIDSIELTLGKKKEELMQLEFMLRQILIS
jgi:uncharacterized protein YydD (DUF2326 family)